MLTPKQERVLRLFREAARQGRSAPSNAEIMERLGLTRGQASGLVFKLRQRGMIPDRTGRRPQLRKPECRRALLEPERPADRLARAAADPKRLRRLLRKVQASWLGARDSDRTGAARRFEDGVRHTICQWIEGQVPSRPKLGRRPAPAEIEATKCGAAVEPGRSYCPAHQARAVRKVPLQVALRAADRLIASMSREW